ncbi:MAG: polyphosphate kinase 2 family protein [Bacteroidetes bacterium]|nr:MAG: polyphosphate kinase 2 family protein [Bacteroidota bacterium]
MVNSNDFLFQTKGKIRAFDTAFSENYESKKDTQEEFEQQIGQLRLLQSKLYAQSRQGVLIILQAMDAAGKDGVIKHVMSGVNPQGCKVVSFKAPSAEELAHDYMWRCMKAMPERGHIGIFNRSYYEEVLIARIHPQLLQRQNLPFYHSKLHTDEKFWSQRYADIVNIEKYYINNGYMILKFFLNVSKDEQKKRFLSRIDNASKNWKFEMGDVSERQYWDPYQQAYQLMLENTNHKMAPWYVIPADKKWYMRLVISRIIVEKLKSLQLEFPQVSKKHLEEIEHARVILEKEK